MSLPKHYDHRAAEPKWQALWEANGTFRFDPFAPGDVYSIDTPPPTVSGSLHVGHLFSYTHQDVVARYRRMRGRNVFYPFGFDDNGLPTECLLEKRTGLRVRDLAPDEVTRRCLQLGRETADEFRRVFRRLGLGADWTRCYSTSSRESQRISQRSFIDLHRESRIYRAEAPTLWCPECRTAIAQAETADSETEARLLTIDFGLPGGGTLPVATTRPELLPACVAVFVHPEDARHNRFGALG
jgi:valyl-tRNA synthetase